MRVSVLLPVINETYSLTKTVEIINETSKDYIAEYIIIICKHTTKESLEEINNLKESFQGLISIHKQKLPYLGGALQEAFQIAKSPYIILMASDMETDPWLVPKLINESIKLPEGIVTASRWIKGGSFKGYSKIKYIFNWFFQKSISILYFTNLTDMTYAYRIMPKEILLKIRWEELRHPFLLETLIKPLRLGVPVKEIPARWNSRTEGESQNSFLRTFAYLKIAVKTRFQNVNMILK